MPTYFLLQYKLTGKKKLLCFSLIFTVTTYSTKKVKFFLLHITMADKLTRSNSVLGKANDKASPMAQGPTDNSELNSETVSPAEDNHSGYNTKKPSLL
jgi:hypothetical protein